ncbi:MAG TPA: DinB family protein [Acidobacteriota bacterium]|nr:DinB family protein [Acidobacteriota bacterium]
MTQILSKSARPETGEYLPYYDKYIVLVPDGPIVETLRSQIEETMALLRAVPRDREDFRYAEGKWSVKEVVGHLSDGERIFSYRALRFGRADETPLPGFDENTYVPAGRFDDRTLASIADEFRAVREATVRLFDAMPDEAFGRSGKANDAAITVRALAWITAGHERHHVGILKERYGL